VRQGTDASQTRSTSYCAGLITSPADARCVFRGHSFCKSFAAAGVLSPLARTRLAYRGAKVRARCIYATSRTHALLDAQASSYTAHRCLRWHAHPLSRCLVRQPRALSADAAAAAAAAATTFATHCRPGRGSAGFTVGTHPSSVMMRRSRDRGNMIAACALASVLRGGISRVSVPAALR